MFWKFLMQNFFKYLNCDRFTSSVKHKIIGKYLVLKIKSGKPFLKII